MALVSVLSFCAVEKVIGDETYFVTGDTYYKAFYSGSDVVYMVTGNPEGQVDASRSRQFSRCCSA